MIRLVLLQMDKRISEKDAGKRTNQSILLQILFKQDRKTNKRIIRASNMHAKLDKHHKIPPQGFFFFFKQVKPIQISDKIGKETKESF